jgi:hypothetical protein
MKHTFSVVVVALLLVNSGRAQVDRLCPINIRTALDTGSVLVSVTPSSSGDSTALFDGDPSSDFATPTTKALAITIEFDRAVEVEASRAYFLNQGEWKLEGAQNTVDLDRRRASYKILGETKRFSSGAWSEISFSPIKLRCVRLTVQQTADTTLHVGEWILQQSVKLSRFVITPCPVRLMPGARMKLDVRFGDKAGRLFRRTGSDRIQWSVKDRSIASIDSSGVITGKSRGVTKIAAKAIGTGLSCTTVANVEPDVRPERAKPLTIKVALVVQDPVLASGKYMHQEFKWRDPRVLADAVAKHFLTSTDSVVSFQIVEKIEATRLFTKLSDTLLTYERLAEYFREPKWRALRAASDSGKIAFDYRELVKYYHFDDRRNSGEIDEVWVFSPPFLGMYESQLLGPHSFWWNSPPIKDGTSLKKLLSVMGLNYERGVDLALHSFGHRIESAIIQAYEDAENRPWNDRSSDPTSWDLFTRIEKDLPGQSHVGNIHFPPNGAHDYDYSNKSLVRSYAQNWLRYPYLFDESSDVNVATWIYPEKDPLAETSEHLGYLRWWFNHLPRYAGATGGVLNNWWHYALDYEFAVVLARETGPVPCPSSSGK